MIRSLQLGAGLFNKTSELITSKPLTSLYKASCAFTSLGAINAVLGSGLGKGYYAAGTALYGAYELTKRLSPYVQRLTSKLDPAHLFKLKVGAAGAGGAASLSSYYHFPLIKKICSDVSELAIPFLFANSSYRAYKNYQALKKIKSDDEESYTIKVWKDPATRQMITSTTFAVFYGALMCSSEGSTLDYFRFMSALGLLLNCDVRWKWADVEAKI